MRASFGDHVQFPKGFLPNCLTAPPSASRPGLRWSQFELFRNLCRIQCGRFDSQRNRVTVHVLNCKAREVGAVNAWGSVLGIC